jgi:Gpi18-like mannosyltransferase
VEKNRKNSFLLLFFLIFLGFFLRAIFLSWSLNFPNNTDFNRYEDWARIAHVYSFADTYEKTHLSVSKLHPNNQPPGTLYIVYGAYEGYITTGKIIAKITHTQAGSILWVNTTLQHIFLRLPQILADIGLGILAYFLVSEKGKKSAIISAGLILFNPVLIYNSTIWGQMDSINNFFFLLSLFFAFRKKLFFSLFSLTVSLFIKFSLLPLLPIYFIFLYFISGKNWKRILLFVFLDLILFVVATFPISKDSLVWIIKEIPIITNGEVNFITNSAFNFWWAITCLPGICKNGITPNISQTFLFLTLNIWSYILFAVFAVPLLFLQIKKSKLFINKGKLFLVLSLVSFAVFLFLPAMHERYLYPLFPLFAIFVGLIKPKKILIILFSLTSFLHLINLIYSWYPTYFPSKIFYQIIYNTYLNSAISIALIVIFLLFYKREIIFLFKKD